MLAVMPVKSGLRLYGGLRTDKIKWRYEVYRIEEDLGPITSFFFTIRNGWYGLRKWMKYVHRVKR